MTMTTHKRLNLLPAQDRPDAQAPAWRKFAQRYPLVARVIAGTLIIVCVGALLNQVWMRLDPAYLQSKIAAQRTLQENLTLQVDEQTNALLARRANLLDERKTLDDQLRALAQPQRSQSSLSQVLTHLVDVVPNSIWVTELRYSNNILSIVGSTEEASAVSAFMQKLDNAATFQNTVFKYTQRETDEKQAKTRYTFEISTVPASGPATGAIQWKN